MKNLKRKISIFAFSLIVMLLPLMTVIAEKSTNAFTAAAAFSGDSAAQGTAFFFNDAATTEIYTGFFCGVQAVGAIIIAG